MENFLAQIAEILEVDAVTPQDELASFEAWDSLSMLSIIALASDNYNVELSNDEINSVATVAQLHELINAKR